MGTFLRFMGITGSQIYHNVLLKTRLFVYFESSWKKQSQEIIIVLKHS